MTGSRDEPPMTGHVSTGEICAFQKELWYTAHVSTYPLGENFIVE